MSEALHQAVAARLVSHLRNNTTDLAPHDLRVPAANFVDPDRARREIDLLRSLALIVGHGSELPNPGSFITRDVLGVPLLIVRTACGELRAFVNMCAHRGGRVEGAASGEKRVFMCQYHGWTYDRDDGALRHVPYEECFENVDYACTGLERVWAEEHAGLVWARPAGVDRGAVADYLGPEVVELLGGFSLDESILYLDRSFTLRVNWKLVMDGANDVLHPKFLHPNGVGKMRTTNVSAFEAYGRHGQVFVPRRRMAEAVAAGGDVEAGWRQMSSALRLYPNAMCIAAPDHVEFWTVWPSLEDPRVSTTNIRFYVRSDRLDDRMRERLDRSWEILEYAAREEDWPMEETIQLNSEARPRRDFLYGRTELAIQHFHECLERDLA